MAQVMDEGDDYSFTVFLNTDAEDRSYHNRNDGDEVQRPNIIDDICRDLLIQAQIDRIVHGCEKEDGEPATLAVFGFRFHGLNEKRRFRQAIITILFQDEIKRARADPEVIGLWPNGDFTLGETTHVEIEDTHGGEVGGNVGIPQAGGQITGKWERKRSYQKTDRATLTGSIILDMTIRDYGPRNAVRLTIKENATASSGLVTDCKVAVLLRRNNDTDRFQAFVKIKAKGDFLYDSVRGLRDLSGNSPANDPVTFKPGIQYQRPGTWAETVEEKKLNTEQLDSQVGGLVATVLHTTPRGLNFTGYP